MTGDGAPVVRVRRATRADVDAVAASETVNLGADAWSPALVRAGILGDLPTVRYLLAEVDDEVDDEGAGEVVGHAVASLVADVAELQRIAVDAGHRRAGVATDLLAAVEAEALAVGAERLLLEVREDNRGAQAFYAAHGFAKIARRRSYYGDGTTAVVMERRLRSQPAS
ncbi:GNAT family N-acetyltransferase [Nocardioides sp. CFH 31398]|uniref:GNAT family N-acetyltransferase n=1 Tax=Nocardioides sp. CFH 31398 TaxID=2919579 RepID=UPI001F0571EB|nr:GNAT family N-acetyltransferase [Nocardioides sp. CFH 31398]MCH1866260.1 GNAT family N-acetyltransferase [Nocardioides sp. CFH 31398]